MNWDIVLRLAGGLGGLAVLIVLPWQIWKMKAETKAGTGKTTADSAAVLTENALKMLEMLEPAQQEIDRLEARLKSANLRANDLEAALKSSQGRVNELEAEVQLLRNQVTVMTKEVTDLRVENSTLRGGG